VPPRKSDGRGGYGGLFVNEVARGFLFPVHPAQ
jgi:hypothetical protein